MLPEASATGQIIFALLENALIPSIRQSPALLYRTATDTGFFRYSNTTATYRCQISEDYQISPSQIAERVYEERSLPPSGS